MRGHHASSMRIDRRHRGILPDGDDTPVETPAKHPRLTQDAPTKHAARPPSAPHLLAEPGGEPRLAVGLRAPRRCGSSDGARSSRLVVAKALRRQRGMALRLGEGPRHQDSSAGTRSSNMAQRLGRRAHRAISPSRTRRRAADGASSAARDRQRRHRIGHADPHLGEARSASARRPRSASRRTTPGSARRRWHGR